ncbi:MAG: GAF domain-containing protein [Magnetococcus sp. DMHC-8]
MNSIVRGYAVTRLLRSTMIRVLLVVMATCAGLLTDFLIVRGTEGDQLLLMRHRVMNTARELSDYFLDGQPMGVAMLLGISEPLLKQAALGALPLDAPQVLHRIAIAAQLVQTDGIYVIDGKGLVVAHDARRVSFTGRNLAFRPYWQQAMAGHHNVYAAVGTTSDERGLYVAAPLYATDQRDSTVIGVVVIKLMADFLDNKLASLGSHALLLSPQSVVFAASVKEWLYRLGEEPTPDKVADIVKLKQFGKLFEKSTPVRLPFALDRDFLEWDGVRHALVRSAVEWHDMAGQWQLVVLQDTRAWSTLSQRLTVGFLAGTGVLLLIALAWLRRQTHLDDQKNRADLWLAHNNLEVHASQLETVVAKRTRDLVTSQGKLENLIQTGLELGRERNRMELLRKLLFGGRDLLHCDVGTLYLVTDHKTLRFALRTNGDDALPTFEIPLYDEAGTPVERFISTWCALNNLPVIIDDIYQESRFDVSGTKKFDASSGYRTVSMLTVPIAPRDGEVIGVLQFLNALDPETGEITVFAPELVRFVTAMAAQAGVALDNHQLVETQKALMDALIKLIAGAIDTKSHYTGAHCERVPALGIMLAEEACRVTDGPLADFRFTTDEEWREFRIGAWLHDCGKVTTPEYVVDKATKLESIYNRIHEIRMRFEVLLRDAMIVRLEAIANGEGIEAATERFAARHAQLVDDFAFVAGCNLGDEFISPERIERLRRIAEEQWHRHFDDRLGLSHAELGRFVDAPAPLPVIEKLLADKPEHILARLDSPADDPAHGFKVQVPKHLYNYGELYNLRVGRGTLTEEERFKINEHVIQTIVMLEQLPLPKEMRRVPEYAGAHHETLTGTGYPRRLGAAELSIPSRIMVIADIFEALTAGDRPYKLPKKLSESVKILYFFKKDGHIDPDLFDLFLRSGVYQRYAEQYLRPEQIDTVEVGQYLN